MIKDIPVKRLATGKSFQKIIKKPTRYNTGNLIKRNNKSLLFALLSTAISNKFIVNRKLAISQLAPTRMPALKENWRMNPKIKARLNTSITLIFIGLFNF
ncbi:MAG: hypothetical protein PHI59_09315 [Candidatus Omnitrophica bacterium]|nr:hypothetical protein [Candidatus Omnitrophota bacterium]